MHHTVCAKAKNPIKNGHGDDAVLRHTLKSNQAIIRWPIIVALADSRILATRTYQRIMTQINQAVSLSVAQNSSPTHYY
jgi:hypothetical protein